MDIASLTMMFIVVIFASTIKRLVDLAIRLAAIIEREGEHE
jgi:hypothetical protein